MLFIYMYIIITYRWTYYNLIHMCIQVQYIRQLQTFRKYKVTGKLYSTYRVIVSGDSDIAGVEPGDIWHGNSFSLTVHND